MSGDLQARRRRALLVALTLAPPTSSVVSSALLNFAQPGTACGHLLTAGA
jgi:hypothetical protein